MMNHEQDEQQLTPSSTSSINSTVRKQMYEDTWVQCDNPKCLKWRRINPPHGDALKNESAWYCFMNRDENFNACDDPQENYAQFERLAKKCRLKYVQSTLEEGTLVWARMAGFCRWPGMITKDPDSLTHACFDTDGHVYSYHVEFLGEKHSHGWINHKRVQVYGTAQGNNTKPQNRRKKKGPGYLPVKKRRYQGMTVECAEQEANDILELLPHDRLEKCVFKQNSAEVNGVNDVSKPKSSGMSNKGNTKIVTNMLKRRKKLFKKLSTKPGLVRKCENPEKGTDQKENRTQGAESRSGAASKDITSPDWLERGQNLSEKLNESASLQGRTKEEKYTMDLDMYVKNQARFERNLKSFMSGHSLTLSRAPCWKDVPVSFFQFFVTVHEHGGYNKVCSNRLWAHVYKELTNFTIGSACAVKRFYRKNLLPYELHLTGHDYSSILAELRGEQSEKKKTRKKRCHVTKITQNKQDYKGQMRRNNDKMMTTIAVVAQRLDEEVDSDGSLKMANKNERGNEKCKDKVTSQPGSSISSDTRHMLAKLDETGRQLTFNILEQDVKKGSEKLDLNICFYDTNDFKGIGDLQKGGPNTMDSNIMPEESPQIVPEASEPLWTDSDLEEQTLNEMVTLGDELECLHKQMIKEWQGPEN